MGSYLQETLRCKGTKICSPFAREINGKEVIGYVSSGTGEVFAYSEGKHSALAYTGGEPYGAVFDSHGKVHIADCAHAAILRVDLANHSHQPGIVVKVYEEKPFRGPSSIAISPANTTYFTDSGPLGETTLENPRGSVFCIAANPSGGQILKPLALNCLAHPCAVAVSPDSKLVYVAEMMANRVLRFVQRPPGIYHMSVFYQFAGGLGPSCIACDTAGRVYVGSYDMAGADAANGRIYVLSAQGTLEHVLEVPGQEITGLCVEGTHKMYVTEATTNALHCISLDAILKS
ncbi:hypothetical protein SDRG_05774 [Saprolegnia diclina VS20]|uniref:SMP-30/Gluconolactonase/LRE-like region domain-containing protein n=1 Tax=Saprolegnia diclina (strain VS20) TaxID=1156394 RepID=T0QG92_SAPDV|nr:hypothetical protein SDRG_05774 [Saprolegnia diclina VS20]EQC36949.1 hypothetical protein SDRG_05774 [Saprolegnia diclina VS20]|eukprot:XP_008609730.1 hypothetical protein SDRG_05774 [Saprolegnia diclina VS20]